MKTKANIAIHHSIGLALSIVRQPSKILFIKGTVSKLHINFSAFNAHLPWNVQGSFKVLSSVCRVLEKLALILPSKENVQKIGTRTYLAVCSVL